MNELTLTPLRHVRAGMWNTRDGSFMLQQVTVASWTGVPRRGWRFSALTETAAEQVRRFDVGDDELLPTRRAALTRLRERLQGTKLSDVRGTQVLPLHRLSTGRYLTSDHGFMIHRDVDSWHVTALTTLGKLETGQLTCEAFCTRRDALNALAAALHTGP